MATFQPPRRAAVPIPTADFSAHDAAAPTRDSSPRPRDAPSSLTDADKEWVVFTPAKPHKSGPERRTGEDSEDDDIENVDGGAEEGGQMFASGWTTFSSSSLHRTRHPSFSLPMPRHDGSGRFALPSTPASLHVAQTQASTTLDTSLYASALPDVLSPISAFDSAASAAASEGDDLLSLPSSLSFPSTGESPAFRPGADHAAESLAPSSRSRFSVSSSHSSSQVGGGMLLSPPHSPSTTDADGLWALPQAPPLTASALQAVPPARRHRGVRRTTHNAAEVVWTSNSENDDVDVEAEFERTPHAHSAGLSARKGVAGSKRAEGGVRVKRRHRKNGVGRSEDGSAKRSSTGSGVRRQECSRQEGKENAERAKVPDVVVESTRGRHVNRLLEKVAAAMDVDEETVKMVVKATPVGPRRRLVNRYGEPRVNRRVDFVLGESPMDLSGAYRARYSTDEEDDYSDDVDGDDGSATEVEYTPARPSEVGGCKVVRPAFPSNGPAQRSLSLSSIPFYLFSALKDAAGMTAISTSGSTDREHDVRRAASVYWLSRVGVESGDGEDIPESREEAVTFWQKVLRVWARL